MAFRKEVSQLSLECDRRSEEEAVGRVNALRQHQRKRLSHWQRHQTIVLQGHSWQAAR